MHLRACVATESLSSTLPAELFLDASLVEGEEQPAVVSTALSIWAQNPKLAALEILDRAMRQHAGEDLDFQFDETELLVPHPFAELIRRAFAPALHAAELCLIEMESQDPELRGRIMRARRCWDRAILQFAQRYQIWEP
jgi:hypothetical protein